MCVRERERVIVTKTDDLTKWVASKEKVCLSVIGELTMCAGVLELGTNKARLSPSRTYMEFLRSVLRSLYFVHV